MSYDVLICLITGAFIVEVLDNLALRYKIRKIEEDIWTLKCLSWYGGNENEK